MPIAVTLARPQGEQVVSDACQRRQAAEIRLRQPDAPPLTLPTVLLAVDAETLHVERACGPDGPVEPAPGEWVQIVFNADDRRFRLDAVVCGSKTLTVGPTATVDAIELERPERVCELQRRIEYRVPLWGTAPVTAHFEPLPVGNSHDAALAEPFHAELQNISAGGVAALVDQSVRTCLATGQHYMMDFFLPGSEEPFTFAVKIQHIRRLAHNDDRLIGLKFLPGDDSETRHESLREVRQFVEVQRRLKS